jgi:hypothetical protein
MNHHILGFPKQLQQPLPQPLLPILSEAFILFRQQLMPLLAQRYLRGRRRQWRRNPTTMNFNNFIAIPGQDW